MFLLSYYLAIFLWRIFEWGQRFWPVVLRMEYMSGRLSMRNPNNYSSLLLLKHLLLIGIIVSIILLPKFLVTSCHLSSFTYLPLVLGTFLTTFHCNKSHKLLFSTSSITSISPLQLLYYDVWCLLWNRSMAINIVYFRWQFYKIYLVLSHEKRSLMF